MKFEIYIYTLTHIYICIHTEFRIRTSKIDGVSILMNYFFNSINNPLDENIELMRRIKIRGEWDF